MMLNLLADVIPVSPNATDPDAWGKMITNVGIPMGCLILILLPTAFFVYCALRWTLGPDGFVRNQFTRWVDTQIAAMTGVKADVEGLRKDNDEIAKDHEEQKSVHVATVSAGHHALAALGKIGEKVQADIVAEIEAAHESLNRHDA